MLRLISRVLQWFFPRKEAPRPPTPPPRDPDAPSEASEEAGHEVEDASAKAIAIFAVALFTIILGTMLVLGTMYKFLYHEDQAIPAPEAQTSFKHAPQAKTSIDEDWVDIDAQARQHLEGYGWTDRKQGLVKLPVERAMELVAREGLPAREGQTTPPYPAPADEKLPLTETLKVQDAPSRLTTH